ncbi:unnamed protein product [Rhizoctonia solani]|uniref:Gcp-like domain-containing protein n=1 Tax=Rhizoctonia solani TaxID=456999 RepID=A0A8H2XHS9_9AGAM|nr:unnamed protein product [Rhizoctonia solani]
MEVSLSGLLTSTEAYTLDKRFRKESNYADSEDIIAPADLCFSLQETVFAMLVEITERAMAHVGSKEVLIVGGVGCRQRTASRDDGSYGKGARRKRACYGRKILHRQLYQAGLLSYRVGQETTLERTSCTERFRTDEALVPWRA